MRGTRSIPGLRLVILALLASLTVPLRDRLADGRGAAPGAASASGRASAGDAVASVLLPGGLRTLALAAAWARADRSLAEGRFWDLLADYRLVELLDPENENAWTLMAHQLAFTVSLSDPDPEGRILWIREGISVAERGLRRLPRSSKISGQIGVLYLERCAGEPRARQAFASSEGQSPIQTALDFFVRARGIDDLPGRWDPYIVLCLDLLARERIGESEFASAGPFLVRARNRLLELRDRDPGAFREGEGDRWLRRVEAWLAISGTLARAAADREAGRIDEARRSRDEAVESLRRLLETHPEDSFAESLIDRLETW
jgi:hypothetical protein